MAEFNGKYRAKVISIDDPENRGRIQVQCPKVSANYTSAWCEACLPHGDFYLPPVGSYVWVEFQQGDLKKPVWTGTWFGSGEVTESSGSRVISYGGATIVLSGGIVTVNGVNILKHIETLESQTKTLEDELAALEKRVKRVEELV